MRRLPDEILKKLNLKDSGKHVGMSFSMDLILYERGDLIVSNYDFTIAEPEKYDPDLSKKNIWLFFIKKHGWVRYFKVSDELLLDNPEWVELELKKVEKEILSKIK